MQTDRHDRDTIVAFRSFAKAPKNYREQVFEYDPSTVLQYLHNALTVMATVPSGKNVR